MPTADVVDTEGRKRDPIVSERVLEGLDRRMSVGFEQQLGPVLLGRRHDRQPAVAAERKLLLLHEAEDLGIDRPRARRGAARSPGASIRFGPQLAAVSRRSDLWLASAHGFG
jgi:hypothetical protein